MKRIITILLHAILAGVASGFSTIHASESAFPKCDDPTVMQEIKSSEQFNSYALISAGAEGISVDRKEMEITSVVPGAVFSFYGQDYRECRIAFTLNNVLRLEQSYAVRWTGNGISVIMDELIPDKSALIDQQRALLTKPQCKAWGPDCRVFSTTELEEMRPYNITLISRYCPVEFYVSPGNFDTHLEIHSLNRAIRGEWGNDVTIEDIWKKNYGNQSFEEFNMKNVVEFHCCGHGTTAQHFEICKDPNRNKYEGYFIKFGN